MLGLSGIAHLQHNKNRWSAWVPLNFHMTSLLFMIIQITCARWGRPTSLAHSSFGEPFVGENRRNTSLVFFSKWERNQTRGEFANDCSQRLQPEPQRTLFSVAPCETGTIPHKYSAGLRSGAHRYNHDLACADSSRGACDGCLGIGLVPGHVNEEQRVHW